MLPVEKTNIVQANHLIENRPRMSLHETRLLITIIGMINKEDKEFKLLEIPVREFADLWDIDENSAYSQIKGALRGLRNKEFFIEGVNPKTGKMRFLTASYITLATYEEGAGYATVEISEAFKPYLLELKKNYTLYGLHNVLTLNSVNAIRTFELLKQYETIGHREFGIDEYKKFLGIENKYPNLNDLKRFVLNPAMDEINQNTDIHVTYETKGRGERAKICWTIQRKNVAKADENQLSIEDYIDVEKAEDSKYGLYREALEEYFELFPKLKISNAELDLYESYAARNIPDSYVMTSLWDKQRWVYHYMNAQVTYLLVYNEEHPIKQAKAILKKAIKEDYDKYSK